MNSGLLDGGEHSGTLNNVLGAGAGPVDVGGIPLTEDDDLGAVDVQEGAVVFHLTYKKRKRNKTYLKFSKKQISKNVLTNLKKYIPVNLP